ncbi:transmembrane protein 44 isoform X1 [Stegostoma tigrinum]|uniref:transmembrane protein 44 isoform X1 n=1 Tax=Stegostoma tigrinum TaxID=3053191 RepID=UPI00202B289E|nr:transmembrane protein 44 isoform X1 [Stegostoma tigrinum]
MSPAVDDNQSRLQGVTPADGIPTASSSLWNWNYWISCFIQEKVCISFALWVLSMLFWAIAHIILFYWRCKWRTWREASLSCTIYTFLGDICNMFGALLAKQLSIQVFTAAYMAAVDILQFILILFPVRGSRSRSKTDRPRQRNKRRSAMFMACLPFAMGTSYYFWTNSVPQVDIRGPRRRLLTTLLQDNTEIIGYALGVIAVFIAWTSKFPLILKASRGKIDCILEKWALMLSIPGGLLYAAATLAHEKTPAFILQALPWLLIFLGSAAIDLSILFLSCLLKHKATRQQWGLEVVTECDTLSLLQSPEQNVEEEEIQEETQSSNWMPLNIPQNNRYLRKMAEIGHYMDLSIEPVQEIGFGVKRLPGDGQTCTERGKRVDIQLVHDPPMYPPKQVIHANVSSCSSSDVTSINSELEQKYLEALNSEQWDFEDIPQEWKMTGKQQEHDLNSDCPDHNPMISMNIFPNRIPSSTQSTDVWLSDTETLMTEERTSAILAQYEEEVNRTGGWEANSLLS